MNFAPLPEFDPQEIYQAVFENSRDAIGLSQAGKHVFVNPAYCKMFGYQSNQELVGRSILDLIAPCQRSQIQKYVKMRETGEDPPNFYETKGLRKDGSTFDMEVTVSSYLKNGGVYTLVILRDISEHNRALELLTESESRFRILAESAPIGIFFLDNDENCLFVNSRWQEITGLKLHEYLATGWLNLIHPEDREFVIQEWTAQLPRTGQFQLEFRFLRRTGETRWISMRVSSIANIYEDVLGFVGTLEDISERRQSENQLKSALEEREVLLREIHHRVKNNFQAIMSLLNLQMRKLKNPELKKILQISRDRIRSMALVHEQLYESQNMARIDLQKYLRQLTRELTVLYQETPNLRIQLSLEALHVPLEQAMYCGQLFTEILANALKNAFPEPPESPEIQIVLRSAGSRIELEMQDNGIGFRPDFRIEHSTTLGLRLILSLVSQLQGDYQVSSENGLHWKVTFPLASPASEAQPTR